MSQNNSEIFLPSSLQNLEIPQEMKDMKCVGIYYPVKAFCKYVISTETDPALQKLKDLVEELSKCKMREHGAGLIEKLRAVALGLSCSKHRRMKPQIEQLPYYWLAIHIFPSFLNCMGHNDRSDGSTKELEEQELPRKVYELSPMDVFYIDGVVSRLKGGWWRKATASFAGQFRALLKQRIKVMCSQKKLREEIETAEHQWQLWHRPNSTADGLARDLAASIAQEDYSKTELEIGMGDSSHVSADGADTSDVTGERNSVLEDQFLRSASQNVAYVSPDLISGNTTPERNTSQGARSLNSSIVSLRTSDLDRDADWKNTAESPILPRTPLKPNTRKNYTVRNPIFRPVGKSKSVIEVVCDVFEEMKKRLIDTAHEDGHVYAFRLPKYPGVIKIGRTKRKIRTRMAEVEVCAGGVLELLNAGDHISIPNYERVETLVLKELEPFRQSFLCNCKSNPKQKSKCDSSKTLVEHAEWFEVSEKRATETIGRWKAWMESYPYSNQELSRRELLRITAHNKERRMLELVKKDEQGNSLDTWDWNNFLEFGYWELQRIQLSNDFFRARREKNDTSSVYDSLCNHWPYNILLYIYVLIVMYFTSASTMYAVVGSFLVFGVAVLYAA